MSKTYIGIDVGKKGFIASQHNGEFTFFAFEDATDQDIAEHIFDLAQYDCVAVIEDVHAIFGSSAKSTFSFGQMKGFLLGLLTANRIPYHLIPPKKWQKEIWSHSDIVKTNSKTDTKKTSICAALRIFPSVDFRRSHRCKNIDDNKVDATLMSEYARRLNL